LVTNKGGNLNTETDRTNIVKVKKKKRGVVFSRCRGLGKVEAREATHADESGPLDKKGQIRLPKGYLWKEPKVGSEIAEEHNFKKEKAPSKIP